LALATLPSFFFLQAEDGIRDFHVTGVQTCALPISQLITSELLVSSLPAAEVAAVSAAPAAPLPSVPPRKTAVVTRPSSTPRATEIGRASCRERGRSAEVA